MFAGCTSLEGGNGTKFSKAGVVDASYAKDDGYDPGSGTPYVGYFASSYKVSYIYNVPAGKGAEVSELVAAGESTSIKSLPSDWEVPEGLHFAGWNTKQDGSGTTYKAGASFTPTKATTLYARWLPVVSFDENGGKENTAPDDIEVEEANSSVGLPSSVPSKTPSATVSVHLAYDNPDLTDEDKSVDATDAYTFTGWNTKANGTGTGYAYSDGSFSPASVAVGTEGVTLYAQWGTTPKRTYGSLTLPTPAKVKKGHSFAGWLPAGSTDDPLPAGTSYTPKSDSDTLTAQWDPGKYKVTCVDVFTNSSKETTGTAGTDYLELGRDESKSFDYDSSVDGAKFAEKAYSGYVYDSCSDAVTVDDSGTQVVYRYYKAKTTIAVEGPGSASGADVATYTASYAGEATDKGVWKGEKVEISNIAMAQDYYELDEVAATEGEVTEAGGTYTYEVPAGGQTITIKAKYKGYKVTYSLNYEDAPDANPKEQSVTYGAKWSVAADPSRADYKFTGWYDNEGCTGDPVTGGDGWSRTSNLPLYAGWEKSALTVSYWIGGSKVDTQAGKVGEPVTVKDASAMEGAPGAGKGWKFKGWAAKADTSKPLYGGTTENATVTTSADFDLYAVFEREVAVSYCKAASDLAVTTDKQTQTLGTKLEGDKASESLSTVSLPALPASDYGWKPLGWLGYKTVTALATITAANYALPAGADGALPALYERSVALEYDGNGGGEPFSSGHTQSVQAGQPADKLTITLAKSRFAKEGQTFAGWSADRSAAGGSAAGAGYDFPNTSWASSAKATVYATWRDSSSFTVNFETGTEVEIPSQTVAKGGKATKPADPTREGRTFGGWYKGLDAYDFGAAVSSDLSLGALWLDGTKRTEQDNVPKEGEKTITEEGELPGGEKVTEIHIVTIPDNIPVSDEVIVERTTPSTKKDTKTEYEDGEPASTTITTTTPAEAPKPGKQVVVVEKRDGKGELIEVETTETDFDDDGKPTNSRVVVTDKVGDVVSITETEFENGEQKHAESTEFTPHQTDPDHPADCTVKKTERNADNNAEKVTETDYDGTAPGKSRETAFDPAQADPDKPKGGKATTTEKDASGNTEKVTERQYDSEGGTGKITETDYENGQPAGTAETVFTPAQADPSNPAGGTVKKTEKDKDGKIEKVGERSYDNDGNTKKVAEESYVDGAKIGTTETTFSPARKDPATPVEGTATKVEKDAAGNERKVTEDTYGPGGVQTGETVTEKETDGKIGKITETDYDNGEPAGTVETEFTPPQATPGSPKGGTVKKTETDVDGKTEKVEERKYDDGGKIEKVTEIDYDNGTPTGSTETTFSPARQDPATPVEGTATKVEKDAAGNEKKITEDKYGNDGELASETVTEKTDGKTGKITETDYENGEPAGTVETVFTPAQVDPSNPAGGTVKKTEKDKDGNEKKVTEDRYDDGGKQTGRTVTEKDSDGKIGKVTEVAYDDGVPTGSTETTFSPARQDLSAPVEGTATKVEKDKDGNERKVTEDTYGPGGVQTGETVTEKETDGKTGKITETAYDNGEPAGTVETEFTPAQADPSNPAGTKVTKTEKDASGKVKEVTEADFDNGGETSGLTRKHYGEDGSLTGTDKVGFTPAQKDPERPAGCVASEVSLDGKGEKSEEKKTTYGDDGSVVGVVRLEYSPAIGENEKVPKPGQVTETTTDDIGDAVRTVTDYGDDGKPTDSVTYEPAEAPRNGVQKRSETTYDYSKSPAVKTTVEYEDSYVDGVRAGEPQRKSTAVYAPATLEFPASTQQTQNVVREEYGKDGATVAVHAETEVTYDTDGKVIRTRTIGQVTGSEIYTVTVVEPAYSGDALVSDTTTVTTMRRKGDVPDTANDESIERAITLANPASSSQVKSGERVSQTQKQAFNKEVGDFVAGGYSETTETFNERKRLENSVTVDYDGVDSSDKGREIAKSTTTYAYDGNGTVLVGSKTAAEQYDYASGEKRDSKLTSTERDGYGNVTSATVTDLKDYYNAANTDASKATVTETSYQYSDAGEDATLSQSTVAEHVVTPANVSDACVQKTSTTVTRRDGAGAVLSTSQRETSVVYSKALDGLHAESVTQEFSPLDGNAGTQAVKLSGTALDSAGAANGGAWLALDVREEAASEQSEPVADAKAAYMRDGALRIGVESLRAYEVSLTRMSKDEAAVEQVSEGLDGLSVTLGVGETSKAVADVLHVHGRSEVAGEFRGVAVTDGAVAVGGEPAKGVTVQVDKLSEFLVALGAPDDVAITFKANGGTGADVVQVAAKGNVALQRNAFTRSGYSFAGWATSASGAATYADGQTIAASSDLTLYAVWKGGASKPSPGAAKSPDQLVAADVADAIAKFTDADPAGSEFGLLQLKVSKAKKSSLKLTWKKQKGATRYVVLGSLCGKKYQQLTTTTGKTFTQKKLKKGKSYKYIVLAYDAAGKRVGVSKTVHAYTAGSKFGNVKKVTFKKKLTLKLKKSKKLKGKAVKMAGKKLKQHRKVMYESSNPKVATVNAKNGKIKAVGKGKCVIYAYACDGKMAKCKVTVK